ncbi:MAG: anaerobic magnesium-protoporphyrin IX monomethyl ester cyclase [Myxococcota bacterium]|jgi:anaerobic magnesium-protoporphyrin IX monomethyl ester cyclase
MHVLFLEVQTESTWSVASIGPAFLAAYLRKNGHTVSIFTVEMKHTIDDVVAAVCQHAPGLIGLSLTTRQWLRARGIVAGLRAQLDVPVIAGGLHPTFAPEKVLASPGFDLVCLGEGEGALLELVEHIAVEGQLPKHDLLNIQRAGQPRPILRPPLDPLDDLPFIARDMLNERYGVRHMITQRGCPFPCTYCAARMYNEMYNDYGRRRSNAGVSAELDALRGGSAGDDLGLTYIIFLDDTFTINHKWVREFCTVHKDNGATPFSLHARVETVNQRMLHELAEAGCKHITYGVESGSERIRREVMLRKVGNQRLIDVFRWTREAGIITTANYMLGVPHETREDLEMTLALHHELQPHDFGYFVFYPYPGTPLFKTCLDLGILPEGYENLPANHRQSILNLPDLTNEDIGEFYDRFTAIREASYLERYGGSLSEAGEQTVRDTYQHTAATG